MTEKVRKSKLEQAHIWNDHPSDLFYEVLMELEDDKNLPDGFWDKFHRLSVEDMDLMTIIGYTEAGVNACEFTFGTSDRAMRRALLDEKGLVDSEKSRRMDEWYEALEIQGWESWLLDIPDD